MTEKLIIIGSGPAGWTAALYGARGDLDPLMFEGSQAGGQLMLTTDVENYPGFPDGVLGPELMELFKKQAERFGTRVVTADVTGVDFSTHPFKVWSGDEEHRAAAVIISTGAEAKWLDIPGEDELRGHGVSSCATCDGFFFKEQEVVVVGGGDSAMEEALFLAKFASEVTIIHRRDELRASAIMAKRALDHDKISFLWNTVVEEVLGDGSVEGVRIRNVETDEERVLETDGMFVAIGHEPATGIFADYIELDDHGYILTHPESGYSTMTSVEGVFSAGDVDDPVYRQAITAAGEGCRAAMDAERWLESRQAE